VTCPFLKIRNKKKVADKIKRNLPCADPQTLTDKSSNEIPNFSAQARAGFYCRMSKS